MPEECVHKNFDKLFKFLLERKLIALGLYRLENANMNKYPFVSTNPSSKTLITIRDRVFVLGKHIPRDLIVDFNLDEDFPEAEPGHEGGHIQKGRNKDFYGLK